MRTSFWLRVKATWSQNRREPGILNNAMPLSITTRTVEPDITVVELSGKLSPGSDAQNIEHLAQKLFAEGVRKLVFDLKDLGYIDSAGIGQIVYSASKMIQAGGRCRVTGARGLVMDVFRITRIDQLIPFSDSVEEACAAVSA